MELKYNPFVDSAIANYNQFKLYPFLVFGNLNIVKNRIKQQIDQINGGFFFGERMVLIGERGIGKTSTLFFIKDMLEEAKIRCEIFSRLVQDNEHLGQFLGQIDKTIIPEKFSLEKFSEKPVYLLIDFPDSVETKSFKNFLEFVWGLITHKNYNKINLIFAMNRSHREKSFSFSEILGKFTLIGLEKLGLQETEELIEARLKIVDSTIPSVFGDEVINLIFEYSKGIPRNVLSACNLLINNFGGDIIKKSQAEMILKEKFADGVIDDRVSDLGLRKTYKQMISILNEDFNGTARSQEDYIKKILELNGMGRNSAIARINELTRLGVLIQYRGGHNRVNKIISCK